MKGRVKIGSFLPNALGQPIPTGMPLGTDELFVNLQANHAKKVCIANKFGVIFP